MSQRLFGRAWKFQVDDLDLSSLDIEFKILRSIKNVPNKCEMTIWNLSPGHRAQFLKRNRPDANPKHLFGIPVQIQAGYQDQLSVLFSGDLRELASMRDGTDWKTVLSGEDGGRAFREGRVNRTFAKGTPVSAVLVACAESMGLGFGNTADFEAGAQIEHVGTKLPHAMTLSGSASHALTRITHSIGLTWSVQAGALQLMRKGQPLRLPAIRLGPDTGLLDSPEAAIDASVSLGNVQQFAPGGKPKTVKHKPKDTGILKVRSLLIPGLVPGRQVFLDSEAFRGHYVICEVEYTGQTWSTAWQADMVLRLFS